MHVSIQYSLGYSIPKPFFYSISSEFFKLFSSSLLSVICICLVCGDVLSWGWSRLLSHCISNASSPKLKHSWLCLLLDKNVISSSYFLEAYYHPEPTQSEGLYILGIICNVTSFPSGKSLSFLNVFIVCTQIWIENMNILLFHDEASSHPCCYYRLASVVSNNHFSPGNSFP